MVRAERRRTTAEMIEFQQIVFPVEEKDFGRGKELFRRLLRVDPYAETP